MKNIQSYKANAFNVAKLSVTSLGDNLEEVVKEYTLVLDFNALDKAKEQTSRDLTDIKSWQDLNPADLYAICWAALDRFHPDISLHDLKRMIPWTDIIQTFPLLIELCFPGIIERMEKAKQEQPGESQPNPPEEKS